MIQEEAFTIPLTLANRLGTFSFETCMCMGTSSLTSKMIRILNTRLIFFYIYTQDPHNGRPVITVLVIYTNYITAPLAWQSSDSKQNIKH